MEPSLDGRLFLTCADDQVCTWLLYGVAQILPLSQTARISDVESGSMKAEMRGHDNRLECAVFVPESSVAAIRELVASVRIGFHARA